MKSRYLNGIISSRPLRNLQVITQAKLKRPDKEQCNEIMLRSGTIVRVDLKKHEKEEKKEIKGDKLREEEKGDEAPKMEKKVSG